MKSREEVQKEANEVIGDRQLSGIEISMGVGKTYIGLKDADANYTNYLKVMVVAPKKTIFESWRNDMVKFNLNHLIDHTTFSTYRSLKKQDFDYDIIYLDECHSLKNSHEAWLDEYVEKGGRIVGLTGTYPIRDFTEKGKMCNKFCPKVYEYRTDDAVEAKILNNYEIIVHELSLSTKKTVKKKGKFGEFSVSEKDDYAFWCNKLDEASNPKAVQLTRIQRMKAIQGYDSKLKYAQCLLKDQNDKVLVFANTKEQADWLCSHSYHSSNPSSEENLRLFSEGIIDQLSAVEQLSEGVNIPNLKIGIIMHTYSNNRKAAQKIGRLLRLNPEDKATIHVLCYADSIDKEWVTTALEGFDQSKIKWKKGLYYAGVHY